MCGDGEIALTGGDNARPEDVPAARLNISPLVNAVEQLHEGLERHQREPGDEQLRDGLIQRFEFTYELSHRMLRRYLRHVAASADLFDGMPFQDLIRSANEHAAILRDVLRQYLPDGARASVFGSRAQGGARQYSDLDLALEWDRPLELDLIGQIAEALSESDLPYKVDIVDRSTVDPAFRARITAGCVTLPDDDAAGQTL